MRKLALVFMICILAFPAVAQAIPKVEVFGGYSLLHTPSYNLTSFTRIQSFNQSGWNAAATLNLNKWFGITSDFAGQYGNASVDYDNLHTFLFGPTISYRAKKVTPFAHVLLGTAHYSGRRIVTPAGSTFTGSSSETGFAMATGGGLDVNLSRRFAVRPVQADWLLARRGIASNTFPNKFNNNFRYSAGFVLRF